MKVEEAVVMLGMPEQLELFSAEVANVPRVLKDAPSVAAALSSALELGHTVKLRKAEHGFELRVHGPLGTPAADPEVTSVGEGQGGALGTTLGFSKRAVELLLRGAQSHGRTLWARPAGGPGSGWTEWGMLSA